MEVTSRSAAPYIRASQEVLTPRDFLRTRSAQKAIQEARPYEREIPTEDVLYGKVDQALSALGQGKRLKPGSVLNIRA